MPVYASADLYIESATSIQDKITAIDAIISALLATAAKGASTANLQDYWLNDGQTQIRTTYRDMADVERSIYSFTRLKNMYINQLNSRMVRLVDSKNFIR